MILDFENNIALVEFTPEEEITSTTYKIYVYATNMSDGGSPINVFISKSENLKKTLNRWKITIDHTFYNKVAKKIAIQGKPLPNIIDFTFKVNINNEETEVADTLSIHFVRYIPKLLNTLGFSNAEKLQRVWFTKGNNVDKDSVNPEVDIVSFDWAISESSQVNTEHKDFLTETGINLNNNYFPFGNKIRESLKTEINRMINDGALSIPTQSGNNQSFGITNNQVITHRGEKIPTYEKYYFNSKAFTGVLDLGIHFLVDGLDDFIAALANFNYHIIAIGELKYETNGWLSDTIDINVKQLGVYIKDSFDFIDDDPSAASQPLGYWKINNDTVEVKRKVSDTSQYYQVTNKSYRDYRDTHNMGYNFHLYSTIKYSAVNYNVTLKDV